MTIPIRLRHRSMLARLLSSLVLCTGALLVTQPPTAAAATFTVTKTTDSKDGTCNSDCSLREAIIAAHQQPGSDTITLGAGTYRVTLSDLDITSNLTIVGASAATTIIESNGQDRVLEVRPDTTVTLDKLTIRNGRLSQGDGGGILNAGTLTLANSVVQGNTAIQGNGGGIFNTGTLLLTQSTVSDNTVTYAYFSGGIASTGTLTLTNSTIEGNQSTTDYADSSIYSNGTLTITASRIRNNNGRGILNGPDGTASITNSTITGNHAIFGGGIYSLGTLTLEHSTISNNIVTSDGGGIENYGIAYVSSSTISGNTTTNTTSSGAGIATSGTLTLTNSTISGNRLRNDGSGGGLSNTGTTTIINSTITDNDAGIGFGGGISGNLSGTVTLRNTIVAGNRAAAYGRDCAGFLVSQGYNLIGDNRCSTSGDLTGNLSGGATLGPLQDNGGPTLTHRPLSGSTAIDAGNPAAPGSGGNACPTKDQRGQPRPTDGNGDGTARCDIGAVER